MLLLVPCGNVLIAQVVQSGDTFTDASGNLVVGNDSAGTLGISGGAALLTSGNATVGNASSSNGTVTVSGTGSTWGVAGISFVGDFGTGSLAITNGASVSSDGGSLGHSAGSSGTVTVDGTGSTLTSLASINVGELGTGSLAITNGGTVSVTNGDMGIGTNTGGSGTVTVDGAGSTLNLALGLFVGDVGSGRLAISNGGVVTAMTSDVGISVGQGAVTVDGSGSTLTTTGTFTVGDGGGSGSIALTNGGRATVGGNAFNNNGSLSIAGAASVFNVGGTFTQSVNGSSTILTGGSLQSNGVNVSAGLFGGTGTIAGNVVVTGGTVQIGASPDALAINGNYTQDGGSLVFEVDPDGHGGFLESTLVLNPGSTVSIDDANIQFDFLNGADAATFFTDGLFNLNTFFTVSNGDRFSDTFGLGNVFQGDTFQVDVPAETIGVDLNSGAVELNALSVPDSSPTLLVMLLGFAVLVTLRSLQVRRHRTSCRNEREA